MASTQPTGGAVRTPADVLAGHALHATPGAPIPGPIQRVLRAIGFGNAFVGGTVLLFAALGVPFALWVMPDTWETWRTVLFGLMIGACFGLLPMGGRLLGGDI